MRPCFAKVNYHGLTLYKRFCDGTILTRTWQKKKITGKTDIVNREEKWQCHKN